MTANKTERRTDGQPYDMARHFSNWIAAFVDHASIAEAPVSIYFWTGVSAVAGALRKKVWIDQRFFRWTPNFFIIIVGPPAVISKSTSTSMSLDLLRDVPGIHFGPDSITWQALVKAMMNAKEEIIIPSTGEILPMSALTIESSELGVFLNPDNQELIAALIALWDGKKRFEKTTLGTGDQVIENPWLNFIGSTTPSWMSQHYNDVMVEGGLSSRIVWLYADKKRQRVAYLHLAIPPQFAETRAKLIEDLTEISKICGEYRMSDEALKLGIHWYNEILPRVSDTLRGDRYNAFLARKQTMVHKLAMVVAAAQRDELIINADDMKQAIYIVDSLEGDLPKIFAHIGQAEGAKHTSELISIVRAHGKIDHQQLLRYMSRVVSTHQEFQDMIDLAKNVGAIKLMRQGDKTWVVAMDQVDDVASQ